METNETELEKEIERIGNYIRRRIAQGKLFQDNEVKKYKTSFESLIKNLEDTQKGWIKAKEDFELDENAVISAAMVEGRLMAMESILKYIKGYLK